MTASPHPSRREGRISASESLIARSSSASETEPANRTPSPSARARSSRAGRIGPSPMTRTWQDRPRARNSATASMMSPTPFWGTSRPTNSSWSPLRARPLHRGEVVRARRDDGDRPVRHQPRKPGPGRGARNQQSVRRNEPQPLLQADRAGQAAHGALDPHALRHAVDVMNDADARRADPPRRHNRGGQRRVLREHRVRAVGVDAGAYRPGEREPPARHPCHVDRLEAVPKWQTGATTAQDRNLVAARRQSAADLPRPGLGPAQLWSEPRGAEKQAGPRRSLVLPSVHATSLDEWWMEIRPAGFSDPPDGRSEA